MKRYRIGWSDEGLEAKNKTYLDLKKHRTDKVVKSFFRSLDQQLDNLSLFPQMGKQVEGKPGYRELVLPEHKLLYYKFESRMVIIATIRDSRQDPTTLEL